MTESFRTKTPTSSDCASKSFIGRSTDPASPSAVLAGVVLHANRYMIDKIKPAALKRADAVVSIAMACDLYGSTTKEFQKQRMHAAGLSHTEIEALYDDSLAAYESAKAAMKASQDCPAEADIDARLFNNAQRELIGFTKED